MRMMLVAGCLVLAPVGVWAQHTSASSLSDEDYLKRVAMAAPTQVVDDATAVRMENSAMKTIKQGTNQWTCMVGDPDVPMCMDPNAMEWLRPG